LALIAIIIGGREVSGHRSWLLQFDHETPQSWMNLGPLKWAATNGFALGSGAMSRIGFWLWYVIPVAALLIGNMQVSAVLYGAYGFTRGIAVWLIILGLPNWVHGSASEWLINHRDSAHTLAAAQLVLIGVSVMVAVGL